ncbi:hypothetical protein HS088_TW14G01098 [Tripterygium wilfordii]|uniref:F-box domain-containing protein n=1 Tax=Tripterygium wilfordii TaxID=458696 RepID=A0A7J7CS75_TRIWF|nr:F-box protein At5g52880-like isoform X1 [Tripterygium wilfordii]XP_038722571.1 F-box protein At5g52880-like isoform X1 [Tripterygium wilfordii]KAF5736932.1 hypothetical protein HS088_TW14G01087 [Tripterygium wilfordii]KAF5736943.1 hypothetical protein HS088_TW14G01098 [Tripterygium wilfordii]
MKNLHCIESSLPDDIALKIASFLQVPELCALGSCSRFWSEICGSDFIWESLSRSRWPFLSEASSSVREAKTLGWRGFYVDKHKEMAARAGAIIKFVEGCCSPCESLEVGDFLKAIEDLWEMQFGFRDVEVLLFKPGLSVLLNLLGLHYCINCLNVPVEYVMEALLECKISERQVRVQWWKLGRWFYGFRLRDESHSRCISLADLALAKEDKILRVLHRGAIHEVLRIQISAVNTLNPPWPCQISPR